MLRAPVQSEHVRDNTDGVEVIGGTPPPGLEPETCGLQFSNSLPLGSFSGLSLACIHMPSRHEPANRRKPETAAPKALPSRNCEHVHAKTANTPLWSWGESNPRPSKGDRACYDHSRERGSMAAAPPGRTGREGPATGSFP